MSNVKHRMHRRLRALLFPILVIAGVGASGQPVEYLNSNEAITAMFPGEKAAEWTRVLGDFNGDGIDDLALVVTLMSDNASVQTRLVVLAGYPDGKYMTLSASAKYCDAQKFFDLESKGPNLYVSAVHKADADGIASETLQFRFNRGLGDMELVGREETWESFLHHSYGRVSTNYRSGVTIEYARKRGRVVETTRSRFPAAQLKRLGGFNCDD